VIAILVALQYLAGSAVSSNGMSVRMYHFVTSHQRPTHRHTGDLGLATAKSNEPDAWQPIMLSSNTTPAAGQGHSSAIAAAAKVHSAGQQHIYTQRASSTAAHTINRATPSTRSLNLLQGMHQPPVTHINQGARGRGMRSGAGRWTEANMGCAQTAAWIHISEKSSATVNYSNHRSRCQTFRCCQSPSNHSSVMTKVHVECVYACWHRQTSCSSCKR
jgi:hypothetical protein